jgi:hypothetical protein
MLTFFVRLRWVALPLKKKKASRRSRGSKLALTNPPAPPTKNRCREALPEPVTDRPARLQETASGFSLPEHHRFQRGKKETREGHVGLSRLATPSRRGGRVALSFEQLLIGR